MAESDTVEIARDNYNMGYGRGVTRGIQIGQGTVVKLLQDIKDNYSNGLGLTLLSLKDIEYLKRKYGG